MSFRVAMVIDGDAAGALRAMDAAERGARRLQGGIADLGRTQAGARELASALAEATGRLEQAQRSSVSALALNATGVTALGDALASAALEGAAYRGELEAIRASFNPLLAALRESEDMLVAVAAAEEMGALSAREAALAHDHLARSMIDLHARAEAAGVPLRDLGPAAQSGATGMQQLIDRMTGVRAASEGATAAALRHGAGLDDLRARFNPIFAASRQYELTLREIAEAERLGAISAHEAATARERAAAAMAPAARAADAYGTATRGAAMQTANLAAQLYDIGVMIAYQNPLQLALQQGTQINQVFAQKGGHRSALAGVGAALAQMLNPMSLLTIGVIGFGAAAVQWFLAAREEARGLDEVLEDLDRSVAGLRRATELASPRGLTELARLYGTVTAEVERLAQAQERAARRSAEAQLQAARAATVARFPAPATPANTPTVRASRAWPGNWGWPGTAPSSSTTRCSAFRRPAGPKTWRVILRR